MTRTSPALRRFADHVPARPVAIIDIGSNSVRLVCYDDLDRAPIPAFNEKSLCGLGNGVVSTGKLPKGGVEKALTALKRFRLLTAMMGIDDVRVIATAAARDATNGPEFVAAARDALGGIEGSRCSRASARPSCRRSASCPASTGPTAWWAIWAAARWS